MTRCFYVLAPEQLLMSESQLKGMDAGDVNKPGSAAALSAAELALAQNARFLSAATGWPASVPGSGTLTQPS